LEEKKAREEQEMEALNLTVEKGAKKATVDCIRMVWKECSVNADVFSWDAKIKSFAKNNCPTDDRLFLPSNSTAYEEDCRRTAGQEEDHRVYHSGPARKKLALRLGCIYKFLFVCCI
jgi:hypothetical protein